MVVCSILMAVFNILALYHLMLYKRRCSTHSNFVHTLERVEVKWTLYSFFIFLLQLIYVALYFQVAHRYDRTSLRVYFMYGDAFALVHPFLLFMMCKNVRHLFTSL
jgi:hypothetical protein